MTHLLFAMAMAAGIPTADPALICQTARLAALPEDRASAYRSCVHDEQAAREQLRQRWAKFSAAARNNCLQPSGVAQSYVEMLTCLEMQSGGNFGAGGLGTPSISPTPLDASKTPGAAAAPETGKAKP